MPRSYARLVDRRDFAQEWIGGISRKKSDDGSLLESLAFRRITSGHHGSVGSRTCVLCGGSVQRVHSSQRRGLWSGPIAIPMLALILPVSTAVSVATVLTTVTSAGQVSREWRHVAWRQFALIFFYSMAGIGLGLYFIQLLDENVLRRCLGVFLILYAVHALWAADTARVLPRRWHGSLSAAVVGGLLSALFGAGAGPIYDVYFDILRLERAVFGRP
jgi:hypothetical protein